MKSKKLIILLFLFCSFLSCQKEGLEGKKSLLDFIVEPSGDNCPAGGFKVISGIDMNNDNILDVSEIQNTKYICNGINGNNGKNSILNVVSEPISLNCSSGGYKITSGIDLNVNNILEFNEIQNTEFICNGDDGINGIDGKNPLINVISEPKGEFCSAGGLKIINGIDSNNNGLLEATEIKSVNYACNGSDGITPDNISVIRIPFQVAFSWRQAEIWWQSEINDGLISEFNINNYPGFDKVYFIAQFDRSPGESSDSLGLRLFDYTNNQKINNSEIWSLLSNSSFEANPEKRVVKSENIYSSLINKNIMIGIQFRKQLNISDYRYISIHNAEIRLTR
jgi:hypothetical protein